MPGPLVGTRVIELVAIGPVPFCGMMLADMGADVIRIDRVDSANALGELATVCGRGKRSIVLDLKTSVGVDVMVSLAATADILIEGFRPGVMEGLGLGPDELLAANRSLVYGRMTGWGQGGPMARMAGHDINYIGLVGVLNAIGEDDPVVPLNLVGDYGGGAMYLLAGVLAALFESANSGMGQVVDAAMVDGAASLMTPTYQLAAADLWADARHSNLLDGAAPFYRTYKTADGGFMAVGALEPQFFARFAELLGLNLADRPPQMDPSGWAQLEGDIASIFHSKPRKHWESVFDGEDACVTAVLSLEEAPQHAHNQARNTFMTAFGTTQPSPAPRFSRTTSEVRAGAPSPGADTADVIAELGLSPGGVS